MFKNSNPVFLITVLLIILALMRVKLSNSENIKETNVILCLEYIVKHHFFLGRSVTVSFPDKTVSYIKKERRLLPQGNQLYYEDVAFKLMRTLNEKLEWPTQVTTSNVAYLLLTDDLEKHHNYIIFTPTLKKENPRIIANAVDDVINEYTELNSLNIHGRYVVVILDNGIQSPPETALTVLKKMYAGVWSVYNVLIIIPYIQDNVHTLQLYTWFPFELNGQKSILLDEWLMENKGKLLKGNNLFPSKIPKKLCTKTLVVQPVSDELVMYYKGNYTDENREIHHLYEGPELDMLNIVVQHLNISLKFESPVYKFHRTAVERIRAALMVLSLGATVDLVIGSLPLHVNTLNWMEFSQPYFITGLTWYVPCPKPYPRLKKIAETFPIEVWVTFFIVFILTACVTYFLSKHKVKNEFSVYSSLAMCFYCMWAIIMGVSVPQMPISSITRSLFLLFVWYAFIMTMLFQTFFTSYLVDPGLIDQIRTIDELLNSDIPMGYNREVANYFLEGIEDSTSKQILERGIDCNETVYNSCFLKVIIDQNYSNLRNEYYAEHFVKTTMPTNNKAVCSLDDRYRIIFIVAYFKKRSPYLNIFGNIFSRLIEGGFPTKKFKDFQDSWRVNVSPVAYKYYEESSDGYFVFSVDHMIISFYTLAVGFILSFMLLIVEFLTFKLNKN